MDNRYYVPVHELMKHERTLTLEGGIKHRCVDSTIIGELAVELVTETELAEAIKEKDKYYKAYKNTSKHYREVLTELDELDSEYQELDNRSKLWQKYLGESAQRHEQYIKDLFDKLDNFIPQYCDSVEWYKEIKESYGL